MATFWDIITSNSSLPISSGNTFWDHLNSQKTAAALAATIPTPIVYGETAVHVEDNVQVVYDNIIHVRVEEPDIASTEDEVSSTISDKHIIIG